MAALTVKMVVVGDCRAGKTRLIKTFTTGTTPTEYEPTVLENCGCMVKIDGKRITVEIWDTPGKDYDKLRPQCYPQTDVFVICFSIGNLESLNAVQNKWVPEIRRHCPDIPIILVGCERHLRSGTDPTEMTQNFGKKPISSKDGMRMNKIIGACAYIECSVVTGKCVEEVFEEAVRAALLQQEEVIAIKKGKKKKKVKESLPVYGKLGAKSIQLYTDAMAEGTEPVYNLRIMVVGQNGVGKTSLVRRLLGQNVANIESTDGIDVHVHSCSLDLNKGTFDEVDGNKDLAMGRFVNILQSVNTNKTQPLSIDMVDGPLSPCPVKSPQEMKFKGVSKTKRKKQPNTDLADVPEWLARLGDKSLISKAADKVLAGSISQKGDIHFFDFGGQFIYYSTHQSFLTKRAIGLLVLDLSKTLDTPLNSEETYAFDASGNRFMHCMDYALYWLKIAHTLGEDVHNSNPPVFLVGTHKDLLPGTPADQEKHIEEFFETVRRRLDGTPVLRHIQPKTFAVNNLTEDDAIENLKNAILEVGQSQPYWGEETPARWIPLEIALKKICSSGRMLITFDDVMAENSKNPHPLDGKDEVVAFLKFHHQLGNLVYFRHGALKFTVVLRPQWIADAFRCFVTARKFCLSHPELRQLRQKLEMQGILEPRLIESVWKSHGDQSFFQHKDKLLQYMEHMGVISKPLLLRNDREEKQNFYLVPCLLRTTPPEDLMRKPTGSMCMSTAVMCILFTEHFLPPPIFHRLLAACLGKWAVSTREDNLLIYAGLATFDLDPRHTLCIWNIDYVINVRLTLYSEEYLIINRGLCRDIRMFLTDTLDAIIAKYHQQLPYTIAIHCEDSPSPIKGNILVHKLLESGEVKCTLHRQTHVIKAADVLQHWFSEQLTDQAGKGSRDPMNRCPTEKEFSRLSAHIGIEYTQLAMELEVPLAVVHKIKEEHQYCTQDQIVYMLLEWRDLKGKRATLRALQTALKLVDGDWEKVMFVMSE